MLLEQQQEANNNKTNVIIVGFSWGGAVLAEMLAKNFGRWYRSTNGTHGCTHNVVGSFCGHAKRFGTPNPKKSNIKQYERPRRSWDS